MSDMTELKASILERSHEQGRLNLAAAKESIRADFEQKKAQLLLEKEAYRRSRLSEINRRVQREKQQLENQARQSALAAKQEGLKELFAAAEAEMSAWSEAEHLAFFWQVIASYTEPVTVQFGQLTADKISESSWAELEKSCPQVTFNRDFIAQEAGFLVISGQVDDNYLYSSLIKDLWETEGFRLAADIFQTE